MRATIVVKDRMLMPGYLRHEEWPNTFNVLELELRWSAEDPYMFRMGLHLVRVKGTDIEDSYYTNAWYGCGFKWPDDGQSTEYLWHGLFMARYLHRHGFRRDVIDWVMPNIYGFRGMVSAAQGLVQQPG